MKLSRVLVPSLLATCGALSTAAAQPGGGKPAPAAKACGVTAIPLSVGNQWVYEPQPPPADRVLTDAQKRTTPVEPKKLTIEVTAIDSKDGVTTVSLSEDLDGKVHNTWIKCNAGGATFQIAPDSFWFAGEAGTSYGIELSAVERKGQTLGLVAGKIAALEWHDDVVATWKHVPTAKPQPPMRTGKLEITRHWVVQPDETITTLKTGEVKAKKLGLETTIKVTVEPAPPEPIKNPPLLVNFLWYVDGFGPVQVLNTYSHMFVLTSAVIK